MIFNLKLSTDINSAKVLLEKMIAGRKTVELINKRKVRTLPQNKYMWVLFSLWGLETGYTKDEAKTVLLRQCPFMIYESGEHTFIKKTSSLEKTEMQYLIEWIIDFAAQDNIVLPTSEDYIEHQFEIQQQLDKAKNLL